MAESLVTEAKKIARSGGDVSPGSEEHYALLAQFFAQAGTLLGEVQVEIWEESQAGVTETRECVTCGGEIIKKHKRGRWPIYCEACSKR